MIFEPIKTLTPRAFATRQTLRWAVPAAVATIACASVLILLTLAMFNMRSTLERVELFVLVGSIVCYVGFALWVSLSFRFRGLLLAQKSQWRVAVIAEEVELMSPGMQTAIPFRLIKTLTEVTAEPFTEISGYEDCCLKLALRSGSTIIVPGSADGYGSAVQVLKSSLGVGFRCI